jgi:hypothetical protein
MFPLTPGTEYIYQGKIVEGGESKAHSVVFTVTGLTKVVGGVPTVVAWDRDFLEGKLQEQELALFAQDDRGNLWNFGEYPEEYENGKFTLAPDTWIRGARGAYGGIHMLAKPTAGTQYTEGRIRSIGFYDLSRVGGRGGDSQEYLSLTAVRHLGRDGMARVAAGAMDMDRRAYRVSKAYRATQPAAPGPG